MKLLTPGELLDRLLPRRRLPLLSPSGRPPQGAHRLELPRGEVLLRQLRLPIGFTGRVEDVVQSRIPKWSAWLEPSWAIRHDAHERGLIHVAIWDDISLRKWLDRYPLAEAIECEGISLVRRSNRLKRVESWLRAFSIAVACVGLTVAVILCGLGVSAYSKARLREAEVRRLAPALNGVGEAALVISFLDRKLSGAGPLADLMTLTGALPDGAWLLQLEWQREKIKASGLADSVDGLLEAVQGDGQLGEVSFKAPVSRSENGNYSFSLEATRAP